jgi:hypothetical protein
VCATSMCSPTLLPERVQSHGSLVTFKLELGNVKIADSDGILSAFTDTSRLPFSALMSRYRIWNVISKTFKYLNKEAGVSRSALKVLTMLKPYPSSPLIFIRLVQQDIQRQAIVLSQQSLYLKLVYEPNML